MPQYRRDQGFLAFLAAHASDGGRLLPVRGDGRCYYTAALYICIMSLLHETTRHPGKARERAIDTYEALRNGASAMHDNGDGGDAATGITLFFKVLWGDRAGETEAARAGLARTPHANPQC